MSIYLILLIIQKTTSFAFFNNLTQSGIESCTWTLGEVFHVWWFHPKPVSLQINCFHVVQSILKVYILFFKFQLLLVIVFISMFVELFTYISSHFLFLKVISGFSHLHILLIQMSSNILASDGIFHFAFIKFSVLHGRISLVVIAAMCFENYK